MNNCNDFETIILSLDKNTIKRLQVIADNNNNSLLKELSIILTNASLSNLSNNLSKLNKLSGNIILKEYLDFKTKTVKIDGSYYNFEIINYQDYNIHDINSYLIINIIGNKVYLRPYLV